MSPYQLTQINIYPVKSLGGISLPFSFAGERGLQFDRRWMLVDEFNRFITQRENPKMATIGIEMNETGFALFEKKYPDMEFSIPFSIQEGKHCSATIFNDHCNAIVLENEVNSWLSEVLNEDCRLIYMPDASNRYVDKGYSVNNETVSFADGFPYLILGESSLHDLNDKLDAPVPMNRFRPNFVFSGGSAFDEDKWTTFNIGEAVFSAVKRCGRCVIITTDQDTGVKTAEPLHTLSNFRKENNYVYFGQNLVVKKQGIVRVNDRIKTFL